MFEELRRATAGAKADYSGITYERIRREQGVFWPCPAEDHAGTPRLFAERFAHPDGRARFMPVRHRPSAELPDARYPVLLHHRALQGALQLGRADPPGRGAASTRSPSRACRFIPGWRRGWAWSRAASLRVESRRGEVVFVVTVSPDIRPDTLFAPFHWGGRVAANILTKPALDPTSRMPEFKVCAVRAQAVAGGGVMSGSANGNANGGASGNANGNANGAVNVSVGGVRKKQLAIVGNGMAACRLIDELIQRDGLSRYEITVFSEEQGGAYNRVLLSKVLAGAKPDSIVTKPTAWYARQRRPPGRGDRGQAPRYGGEDGRARPTAPGTATTSP